MNSRENILLSILHSAGVSQNEFRKIFLYQETSLERVFEEISRGEKIYQNIIPLARYQKIIEKLKNFSFEERKNFLEKNKIFLVNFFENHYPESLKHIHNYPFLLYYKGNIKCREKALAVVGTRKPTNYGEQALKKIFREFPDKNISIISGGAYGIDTLAHTLALEYKLHTIAVFGTDIMTIYPTKNAGLFEQILANSGGIISIFPLPTRGDPYNFPIRNEIVVGLAEAIIIPECSQKSGTLITARLAVEYNKDVFAIPGDINRESSAGCNELLNRSEAHCLLSASDIFTNIFYSQTSLSLDENTSKETSMKNFSQEKHFTREKSKEIYEQISLGNNNLDGLSEYFHLNIGEISTELALLEIEGHILQKNIGVYEIIF